MNAVTRYVSSLILVSLILFPCSCGYRPLVASVPGGGIDIYVPIVKNGTPFPGLQALLTEALREKSAASGLHVVGGDRKAPRIEATIISVVQSPGMLRVEAKQLIPVDAIWSIRVEAALVAADGHTLRGPSQFEVKGRAYAGGTVTAEESLGQHRREALMDDAAEVIVSHMFL